MLVYLLLGLLPVGAVHTHTQAQQMLLEISRSWLIMSSPEEQKISYVEIGADQKATGPVHALIDSGLIRPHGIAWDSRLGHLYVCDTDASKVYRFIVKEKEGKLYTDDTQVTVVSGRAARWIAVDPSSNVYISDETSSSIDRIDRETLYKVARGEVDASEVVLVTAQEAQSQLAAKAAESPKGTKIITPPPYVKTQMTELYSASASDLLSSPGGVSTDGHFLYWTNVESGQKSGAVNVGVSSPVETDTTDQETAHRLASNTNTAFGLVATGSGLFFTDKTRYVYGMKATGGNPVKMVDSLQTPRGLAWDGDGTIFVADQTGANIYSFPCGQLMEGASVRRVVAINGPFGLAMINSGDNLNQSLSAVKAVSLALGLLFL